MCQHRHQQELKDGGQSIAAGVKVPSPGRTSVVIGNGIFKLGDEACVENGGEALEGERFAEEGSECGHSAEEGNSLPYLMEERIGMSFG